MITWWRREAMKRRLRDLRELRKAAVVHGLSSTRIDAEIRHLRRHLAAAQHGWAYVLGRIQRGRDPW